MKTFHQPIQYTYSSSFRKLYQDLINQKQFKQYSQRQQPNTIFLEYQNVNYTKIKHKQKQLKQPLTKNKYNSIQSITQNTGKRLHTSSKKYSFSVFVKQSRKNQKQRKSNTNSLQTKQINHNIQSKIKGNRKLNQAIRTIYQNFRKTQNVSRRSQINKQINNLSCQIKKPQPIQQRYTNRGPSRSLCKTIEDSKESKIQGDEYNLSGTKINFVKTMTFGEKLHHSKQLQNFRTNECSSKGFICIGKKQILHNDFNQQLSSDARSFLKIQKCSLQKKQQQFYNHCIDLKQIMLKDRLQKQNKKKTNQIMSSNVLKQVNQFSKYMAQTRQNKYVSEMRGVKKTKKKWFKDDNQDNTKNKIQPW